VDDRIVVAEETELNPHVEEAIKAVAAETEDEEESPFQNFGSHQNYYVRQ